MSIFDQPISDPIPEFDLKNPKEIVENLFGPQDFSGISFYYSSKGLQPWEAGATWGKEIRLQPAFKKKGKWRLADRDEVIAHEIIHALRSDLNEPLFEEMLAFSTAKRLKWLKSALASRAALWTLTFISLMSWLVPSLAYGAIAVLLFQLHQRVRIFNRCQERVGLGKMLRMSDNQIKKMGSRAHTRQRES